MATLSATRKFRLKILSRLLTTEWYNRVGRIILPEYFEQDDEVETCQYVHEYWHKYHRSPSYDDMMSLSEGRHSDLIASLYIGRDEWDTDYAGDAAVQFAREQAAKGAVLQSLDDINAGRLDVVLSRLSGVMKIGQDDSLGISIHDPSMWLRESVSDKFGTGLIHLDIAMDGGLAAGELGVFLGPPNRGKSMALINVGVGAAGPISRLNVAHFSFEMNAEVVAKRYAARLMFRFPSKSDIDNDEYRKEFSKYADVLLPGDIRIFRVSGNCGIIRSHLDMLTGKGFDTGVIIIDHGDLVKPYKSRSDRYTELGEVFSDLRDIAHDYDCPLWTATQGNRASLHKEIITMADLADSFQKAGISDAIIALCQTDEEEEADQCRLYVAKLRDGISHSMIRAKYFKRSQALVTVGFVKRTEKGNATKKDDGKDDEA